MSLSKEMTNNTFDVDNTSVLSIQKIINNLRDQNENITDFVQRITKKNNYVSYRTNANEELYMLSCEWYCPNKLDDPIDSIPNIFNNLVLDSDFNVKMYGGPRVFDSNRDKFTYDDSVSYINNKVSNTNETNETNETFKTYEAYEGTTVNVFNHNDQWYFSTKRKFNMFESFYGSNKTHGQMFQDIIGDLDEFQQKLNPDYTYQFVVVHKDNCHLSKIEDNKLILICMRDLYHYIVTDEIINEWTETLKDYKVTNPSYVSYDSKHKEHRQGIIIKYKDIVFRIYDKTYGENLKQRPRYSSKQEQMFHSYQKNEFNDNSDEKTQTNCAFNFVAIMLFRTLNHFTDFNTEYDSNLKFKHKNNEEYEVFVRQCGALARNIYKLQRLLFIKKDLKTVDFQQVKHHLRKYSHHKDLSIMFEYFNQNKELQKLINYKAIKGTADTIQQFSLV